MTAPSTNSTLACARSYLAAGLSFIPVRRDGSKAPESRLLPREKLDPATGKATATWEPFKTRLPTEPEVGHWFDRSDPPGIGVLGGAVSGGLECIDFDVQAESIYPQWRVLVESERPGLLARLCVVRTPRPGFHVRYRCVEASIAGNSKLAVDPALPANNRCLGIGTQ